MNVFEYTDYRKFLNDYYREQKARDGQFTVRYIAEKVGFRSASFFSQLIRGRSNISMELLQKFCDFICFSQTEREYFVTLVNYNQTRDHAQKKVLFEKLISFKHAKIRTVDARLYELYDKWYYTAIRELLYFHPFSGDYKALARLLIPSISQAEARRAIRRLEKWQLIIKDNQGRFVRSDNQSITTGLDAQSFYINNFQMAALDLAKAAIDLFPRESRSFSTLTMSLSSDGYQKIEAEIHRFRRQILAIAEADVNEDRVYQMNVQMFPMSKSTRELQ
ncbi:MAG TPA: TIGR02147 family protein [Armatimonadota bacterium]|nr:TIGR02147 family protein [Armatimonadota bacterium]